MAKRLAVLPLTTDGFGSLPAFADFSDVNGTDDGNLNPYWVIEDDFALFGSSFEKVVQA